MQQHVDALLQKIEALQEHTRKLEKQISRSGREQLKTNSLTETQMERLQEALEQLRATDERRESEINTLRQQLREERTAGRLEVVQALFPTLDGLDEALRAGEQLLPSARPAPQESTRPMTVFERLAAMRGDNTRAVAERADLQQKMRAWLEGLTFVRQRLLDVLAAEGVHPIAGVGHPFDPQRHVALEVVPASEEVPPNTVATELRRGYALDDRIVRYAEVAVAKAQDEQTAQQKTPDEMKGTE
jgi:molecular chaperone GrpE